MEVLVSPRDLQSHVKFLAEIQPPRNFENPESMKKAAAYIFDEFKKAGLQPREQKFKVQGKEYKNIGILMGPQKGKRLVIGAHYDVAGSQPGADDNASGIAGLLELARLLARKQIQLTRPIELVAFALEEPPIFGTTDMGSHFHAESLYRSGVKVELMISLEMIGYYSEAKGSQNYPVPLMKFFYPNRGHFISLVGRNVEKEHIQKIAASYKKSGVKVPMETLASAFMVTGVDLSDHSNYWRYDFPAVMVTDTAFMRNPHYHTDKDLPETLDYGKMAEVVKGLHFAILDL
jgi:Zn-dependent M28 family amino/carboxypeptidase